MRHAEPARLTRFFGQTFITHLNPSNPELAPLKVGTDTLSIFDIATKLGATNVAAARRLTELADAIGARNVRDFYKRSTPYSMATSTEGIGVTTLYVAWRLFEAFDLDPEEWYDRGMEEAARRSNTDAAVVSFLYFKKREQDYNARARKAERRHRAHPGNAKPSQHAVAHDRPSRRRQQP